MLTSANYGGHEDVVHDSLGEGEAHVAVVDCDGRPRAPVHLAEGHLGVLVKPGREKILNS